MIETRIAGEERRIALLTQENENFFILQTLAPEINTNLPRVQPPCLEGQALSVKDILVENDQA